MRMDSGVAVHTYLTRPAAPAQGAAAAAGGLLVDAPWWSSLTSAIGTAGASAPARRTQEGPPRLALWILACSGERSTIWILFSDHCLLGIDRHEHGCAIGKGQVDIGILGRFSRFCFEERGRPRLCGTISGRPTHWRAFRGLIQPLLAPLKAFLGSACLLRPPWIGLAWGSINRNR